MQNKMILSFLKMLINTIFFIPLCESIDPPKEL